MKHTSFILALIVLLVTVFSRGATPADSVTVHFRQGKSLLDTALFDNGKNLSEFVAQTRRINANPDLTLKKIDIFGAASPEGPVMLNRSLSDHRAHAIYDYLSARIALPDSLITFRYASRDWSGLRRMVENDSDVPDREEVLSLLDEITATATPSTAGDVEAIERLQKINNGATYRYLYSRLYPSLRESGVVMHYSHIPYMTLNGPNIGAVCPPEQDIVDIDLLIPGEVSTCKPFYMALKTNLLFDALALPNIGAEFYVGKNISVGANWMYGWWDKNKAHRYWRAYGGDLNVRWWFGHKAAEKPLTGHHLGVYGGIVTYDFEFGGKGWMGGLPGRTLWDRSNRFAGIEYGYSLPVSRRLNIDFTLGVGYFGGKYIIYKPKGNEYEWQSTHNLTWFGPSKAEISLVWLIGCDNYNRKGNRR